MKSIKRIVVLVAFLMLITGGVLLGAGYSKGGKHNFVIDFKEKKLQYTGGDLIEKVVSIDNKEIDMIEIDMEIGDIRIVKGDEFRVTVSGDEKLIPDIENRTSDSVLRITSRDKGKNTYGIGILNFFNGKLTVGSINPESKLIIEVPENAKIDTISLDSDLGNVIVEGISADILKAEVDLGNIEVRSCSFNKLNIVEDSGNIEIKSTISSEINLENDLGNIEAELIGNIDEYVIYADTDLGNVEVNGDNMKNSYDQHRDIADKSLRAVNDCGNITINIEKNN